MDYYTYSLVAAKQLVERVDTEHSTNTPADIDALKIALITVIDALLKQEPKPEQKGGEV